MFSNSLMFLMVFLYHQLGAAATFMLSQSTLSCHIRPPISYTARLAAICNAATLTSFTFCFTLPWRLNYSMQTPCELVRTCFRDFAAECDSFSLYFQVRQHSTALRPCAAISLHPRIGFSGVCVDDAGDLCGRRRLRREMKGERALDRRLVAGTKSGTSQCPKTSAPARHAMHSHLILRPRAP
jgi:hypothetical protein